VRDSELNEVLERRAVVDRSDTLSSGPQLSSAHSSLLTRPPFLSFMDASQFSRWTRFAKKGGIGKCVALKNCAAEHPGDLMFFKVHPFLFLSLFSLTHTGKGDEITVLMQLSDEDGLFLVRFLFLSLTNLSKPATAHRATVKVSLAALQPLMFSLLGSLRHP
jgi:hypothetical protein